MPVTLVYIFSQPIPVTNIHFIYITELYFCDLLAEVSAAEYFLQHLLEREKVCVDKSVVSSQITCFSPLVLVLGLLHMNFLHAHSLRKDKGIQYFLLHVWWMVLMAS